MMGITLPLAVEALSRRGAPGGRALAGAYAINTLGAAAGALAAGYVALPLLGARRVVAGRRPGTIGVRPSHRNAPRD